MNIVWICSEAVPYAKAGGLADVSGALPAALAENGHKVSVIMPYYPQVMGDLCSRLSMRYELLKVPMGWAQEGAAIREDKISDNLSFYFIEYQRLYDRPFLYDYYGVAFGDNAERYIFLCRAAMETICALNLKPDILHTNDWHSSLCNVYLKSSIYSGNANFAKTKSVLTIHNIEHQGIFSKENLFQTGLNWDFFNYTCLEYYDQLNFLKGGIMTADAVTTVSPTYAREILTPDYAFSLDSSLRHIEYAGKFYGILNGIDTDIWNPASDKLIPHNYSRENLKGKQRCKIALQKRFSLKLKPKTPVIGLVSRLAYQKGIDVFSDVIYTMLNEDDVQFVILGSGDSGLESKLSWFCEKFPHKIGVYIGYNNDLAHLIEAGSDFFVMPSRYEPCGLNQMYSMRYGTVPVVRSTGGLEDTVINYDPKHLKTSNGFKFLYLNHNALLNTIRWAVSVYNKKPDHFSKLIDNGMSTDFSWHHTAGLYENLYKKLTLH